VFQATGPHPAGADPEGVNGVASHPPCSHLHNIIRILHVTLHHNKFIAIYMQT